MKNLTDFHKTGETGVEPCLPHQQKPKQARIHTGFHRFTEIGHIFHNKYIFDNKNTFKVGIWPVSCLNDYEIQERGL